MTIEVIHGGYGDHSQVHSLGYEVQRHFAIHSEIGKAVAICTGTITYEIIFGKFKRPLFVNTST